MSQLPLLSLVIPTKNRKIYLLSMLKEIARQNPSGLEVIVHDNSDAVGLEGDIGALNVDFIRYFYTSDSIGVHENFERAVAKATGDYLCAIGDDDGLIVSAALELLLIAKREGIEAVQSERIYYAWPGMRHRLWGDSGGRAVRENLYAGLSDHVRDPIESLSDLFALGGLEGISRLPQVYHGYVAREAMDRLRERAGGCFPGASPDMANATALSGVVNKLMITRTVTLITGHSRESAGGDGAAGVHHADLENAVYVLPSSRENWLPAIPRFWSGMTVYAQAAIEGTKAGGAKPTVPFNYMRLGAACIVYQPRKYHQRVRDAISIHYGDNLRHRLKLYALAGWLFIGRVSRLLRMAFRQVTRQDVIGRYATMGDLMAAMHEQHKNAKD